jgi:hypothetical protein
MSQQAITLCNKQSGLGLLACGLLDSPHSFTPAVAIWLFNVEPFSHLPLNHCD